MSNFNIDCLACSGRGKIYEGDSDPVEGYKLVPYRICHVCKGVGNFIKNSPRGKAIAAFNKVYDAELKKERKATQEEAQRIERLIVSAKGKLTDEEYEALTKGKK